MGNAQVAISGLLWVSGAVLLQGCSDATEHNLEHATSTSQAAIQSTPARANINVKDYVRIPGAGWAHRACVHDVPDGARITRDGRVLVKGELNRTMPTSRCPYAVLTHEQMSNSRRNVGSAPNDSADAPDTPPPAVETTVTPPYPPKVGNGNLVYTYQYATSNPYGGGVWWNQTSSTWVVPNNPPAAPTNLSTPLLYFYNGIGSYFSGGAAILQPVLQWGQSPAGGSSTNPFWAMGSWYVVSNGSNQYAAPPITQVYPGDTVVGTVSVLDTAECSLADGTGCTYAVSWVDTTTGSSSTIEYETPYKYTVAFPAVLEAYDVYYCNEYPSSPVTFFGTTQSLPGPSVASLNFVTPNLTGYTQASSSPCNYKATPSGTTSVLSWDAINAAPSIDLAVAQTITLPQNATLHVTVYDDGLPDPPAVTTIAWSVVSGPGTVTIATPSANVTTASFSAAGTYVVRVSVTDGILSASADQTVTVNAAPVNAAPVVNAGPDQVITLPATATLAASVTDDGLPNPPATVTKTWTKVSGPGTVTFANPASVNTTAFFSSAGTYVLRITASDGSLSMSDDITITVNAGSSSPCAGICSNPVTINVNGSYQSGAIGTGAGCYQTTSPVHGGNCGNFVYPRTLQLNGATKACNNLNWASIPAKRNGGYCVQIAPGNQSYAYFVLF